MPVFCKSVKISYYPIPKIGSTTMRAVMTTIDSGGDTNNIPHGAGGVRNDMSKKAIRFREALEIEQESDTNYERMALLRDPVSRFLSGFQNKVMSGRLEELFAKKPPRVAGLSPRPDIEAFVVNFTQYKQTSQMIRQHFKPQSFFLGRDLGYFQHVFRLENFAEVAAFLNSRTDQELIFPHYNQENKDWVSTVPDSVKAKIADMYKSDYRLLAQLK